MTDPHKNGWTQYQKLVLSEIERHNARLDALQKELVNIKLKQSEISTELSSGAKAMQDLSSKIEKMINASNQQKTDIEVLKLKIYGVVTALCAATTFLTQWGGKILFGK